MNRPYGSPVTHLIGSVAHTASLLETSSSHTENTLLTSSGGHTDLPEWHYPPCSLKLRSQTPPFLTTTMQYSTTSRPQSTMQTHAMRTRRLTWINRKVNCLSKYDSTTVP